MVDFPSLGEIPPFPPLSHTTKVFSYKTASQEVREWCGTKKNSTLEVKPHYVGSIEVTKRPIFVRGAVSLRALVRAVEPENRF